MSRFADRWGFFLGTERDLRRIDNPGKWEDILFSFARDRVTGTVREDMSYTLQFRGDGGEVLRRRITGLRTTADMVLEVRYWHPLEARWEVYWRGVIDDSTIVQHADYVEAKTKPVGVAEDLISKADNEYTVQLTGKRIEVPRVAPYAPLTIVQKSGGLDTGGKTPMANIPAGATEKYDWSVTINPSVADSTPILDVLIGGTTVTQPYIQPSAVDNVLIVAKSGTYTITNNLELRLTMIGSRTITAKFKEGLTSDYGLPAVVPPNQTYVLAGSEAIPGGLTKTIVLARGEVIKVCARTKSNGNLRVAGDAYGGIGGDIQLVRMVQYISGGSLDISPAVSPAFLPPLTAPAVRDIDLFAQLCRQVTRNDSLAFDFSKYEPAYMDNPDGSPAAAFLLCLSRLKESLVTDGVATPQGTDEAYFKGLTLNMFYKYFLAQGYKVGVENRLVGGVATPTVFVASYCNTNWRSYFYPAYNAATSPVIADLGTAVTDIELSRYEHTFLQVVAGRDPEDFGAFPREEGYQDPCNRKITYGIGVDNPGEAYEISVPFPLTTLGLEEELQKFEGESDEARQQRWTEGEGIHLVCGTAGTDGKIASITQYPAVPGLFYRPLNMGFRPESLMRRNLPLLCMSLAPFDMDDTVYTVEEIEGDDISVTSAGAQTGDAYVAQYSTDAPVSGTSDEQSGIFRPVMVTFRSGTDQNIYARLADTATRYGVVKFRYRGREVVGYLRGIDLNPTERSVQKWEILPVWSQSLDFLDK